MTNNTYYDGTKLLSLKDLNGQTPEIYISTSNRSAGKTTYFNRLCFSKFLKYGEQFMVLYRFNYELSECHHKFFDDIKTLFFQGYDIMGIPRAKGKFVELCLNEGTAEEPCQGVTIGWAVALNDADIIKKCSHMFANVTRIIMDEFQSETNHYCSDEIRKFISIHQSVARGNGKQSRYVPVYLIGNFVTLLNPYYIELGISSRLQKDTNYLRGDGWVLEQCFNEAASKAQQTSAFNRAFANNQYVAYSSQKIYLEDNYVFVQKIEGNSNYIATIRFNDKDYAIREYDCGLVYCDTGVDQSYPVRFAVTTDDHAPNYVMLSRQSYLIQNLRSYYEHGIFRFKNLDCKQAIMTMLSY